MNKEEIYEFEINDDVLSSNVETIKIFLEDEFFLDLEEYLMNEDYALAKDAVKGLYILAMEFKLYHLYETLLDIYEDLEVELYDDVMKHYELMRKEYYKLKEEYENA